jgi:Trypsin-like peptidase domain
MSTGGLPPMTHRDVVVAEITKLFGGRLDELAERLSIADEGDAPDEPSQDLIRRHELLLDGAHGLRKILDDRQDELTGTEVIGLEAIIALEGRPALFIQGGDFIQVPIEWQILIGHRDAIKTSIARVGRVQVTGHPNYEWIGTGFLAGSEVIITNRHVAREFARADGDGWRFEAGMSANLDFNSERGALQPLEFALTAVVGVHERLDLAVLKIARTGGEDQVLANPLRVAATQPGLVRGRTVYVVGYPAWDGRRNDPAYMRQIFRDVYDVKRLQPGMITSWIEGRDEFVHDCSTLGGNSGSPVFDLETHEVVGLHFGGRYLWGNNAIPLWRLTGDGLLREAGVNFT